MRRGKEEVESISRGKELRVNEREKDEENYNRKEEN